MNIINPFQREDSTESSLSLYPLIQQLLRKRFNEPQKHRVADTSDHYRFSCPVCGDSHKDLYKRRAYVYKNSGYFKCFNCGSYMSVDRLFSTFSVHVPDDVLQVIAEKKHFHSTQFNNRSSIQFEIDSVFSEMPGYTSLPSVEKFIQVKKLSPTSGTNHGNEYLSGRSIDVNNTAFYYRPASDDIYILNIIGNKVVGYQTRSLDPSTKKRYRTSNLETMLREESYLFETYEPEDLKKLYRISTIFYIGKINMNDVVTVLEGPLDASFIDNSVAVCSASNRFHISSVNHRYLFDNDRTGRSEMMKIIKTGGTVFLWEKFLHDAQLPKNQKWDINDLVLYSKSQGTTLPPFFNYFSDSPYDIVWI